MNALLTMFNMMAGSASSALALTGTFPNATVGTAWTGVLTFSGTYTGPVVMDVAAGTMPAWITSVVVDETAKTATYSGTPATGDIATDSFTPRATPATGTAVTAPQSFSVAAAASAVPVVVQTTLNTAAAVGNTLTFVSATTPVPGNYQVVLIAYNNYGGRHPNPPDASWAVWDKGVHGIVYAMTHLIAQGESSTYKIPFTSPNHYNNGVMYEVTGTNGQMLATLAQVTSTSALTVLYPFASTVANGLPIAWYVVNSFTAGYPVVDSQWTLDQSPPQSYTSIHTYLGNFPTDATGNEISITQKTGSGYSMAGFILAPA